MSLSDIVSRMGATTFAEVALVLFFLVFVGICVYTFLRRNRERYDRARYLPLEDDVPSGPPTDRSHGKAR